MQVDCEIGEVDSEGLRGVRAKRDMQLHQMAVKLPKIMAITLKEWNKTSEVPNAALLQRSVMHDIMPISAMHFSSSGVDRNLNISHTTKGQDGVFTVNVFGTSSNKS